MFVNGREMSQQKVSLKPEIVQSESLEQAFQHFNEVSSSLTEFYAGLEQKVSLLNKELADTRTQKLREYE